MKKPFFKNRIILVIALCAVAVASLAAGLSNCFGLRECGVPESLGNEELLLDSLVVEEEVVQTVMNAELWADSVMATLSPRQRIAQLFVPRWDLPVTQTAIEQQIAREGFGGFLLGKAKLDAYVDVINRAQAKAKVPLLVTLDGEWGLNMRVPDAPRFPKNIALGAIQNESLLEEYGREVARECLLTGIQVDFAPVLDVNSNPSNPVIGYRSFGENPERVAQLGAAFCKGMESGGVMSVGKHFPGHGDTSLDSHKALPTVDHSVAKLDSVDLLPFRVAIDAGMSGIMVGHLKVPALDKSGTPASLSKKITTDLLQNEMGFEGLIFTDALAMKGAATVGENNCVSAFKAGADILLNSAAPLKDLQAMVAAVNSGAISQKEVDRRCKKLLMHKYRLGLTKPQKVDKTGLYSKINTPETKALLGKLAKASITVTANNGLLPLDSVESKKVAVVSLGSSADNEFSRMCAKYAPVTKVGVNTAADLTGALSATKSADVVIVGVFKADSWVKDAFAKLKASKNLVPVFFVNPFRLKSFVGLSELPILMMAYDDTPELLGAAAQAVFGGIEVTGRFPVNISGVASIGDGVDLKKKD